MVTVMPCHGVPVNVVLRRTVSMQCPWVTRTHAAAPISSDALPVDGSTVLRAPLRFLPLHSQTDKSSLFSQQLNCHPTVHPTSWRRQYFRFRCVKWHMLPQRMTSWHGLKCAKISPSLRPLGLDDIREAQSIDDDLQPVIQAFLDKVKPQRGSLCDYPEEARVLFSQWVHLSSRMASCIVITIILIDGTTKVRLHQSQLTVLSVD